MRTYKLTAVTASVFSVLFSISILFEIFKFVELFTFILISVFLVLFVIYNEVSKINELHKYFRKQKSSMMTIVVTFILSFFLSGIGIWFWTNDTYEEEIKLDNSVSEMVLEINQKYQVIVDSINSIQNDQYKKLQEQIEWWRNRKSDSKFQRNEILINIRDLEQQSSQRYESIKIEKESHISKILGVRDKELSVIDTQKTGIKKRYRKNNFISAIFFIMVLITELIIVNVQYQMVNIFNESQRACINILKDCELRNMKTLTMNEYKFNQFNQFAEKFKKHEHSDEDWKVTKKAYNILGEIGLVDQGGKILVKNSGRFLENYFSNINKF